MLDQIKERWAGDGNWTANYDRVAHAPEDIAVLVKAVEKAVKRLNGDDCPPDADIFKACDNDCRACWLEWLFNDK